MLRELFLAAKRGDLKALQDIYGQNHRHVTQGLTFEGNSALHIAARKGHLEVVEWVLGVKPCLAATRNFDKNTTLHEAAKKGRLEVVRIFLEYNKYVVYMHNQFGETTLIIAS